MAETPKTMRISITEEHRKILEQKARELGCVYSKNRGISELLKKIALSELTIVNNTQEVSEIREENITKEPLVELVISVVSDLNGSVASISEIIADSGGNIYDIRAYDDSELITIIFEPEDKTNKLFRELKSISFDRLKRFNSTVKIDEFIRSKLEGIESSLSYIGHGSFSRFGDFLDDNETKKALIKKYAKETFISNIKFAVCFMIEAKNKPRVLATVAKEIAGKQITIRSIKQTVNHNKNICFLKLVIVFNPDEYENIYDEIGRLKSSLKHKIGKENKVYQISMQE